MSAKRKEQDPIDAILERHPKPEALLRAEEREMELRRELAELERELNRVQGRLAGVAEEVERRRTRLEEAAAALVEGREPPPELAAEREELLRRQGELTRRIALLREAVREAGRRREVAHREWTASMADDVAELLGPAERRVAGLVAVLAEAVAHLRDLHDGLRRRGIDVAWPRVLPVPAIEDPRPSDGVVGRYLRELEAAGLARVPEVLADRWREEKARRRELEEAFREHGAVSAGPDGIRYWDADARKWVRPERFRPKPGRFAHVAMSAYARAHGARG